MAWRVARTVELMPPPWRHEAPGTVVLVLGVQCRRQVRVRAQPCDPPVPQRHGSLVEQSVGSLPGDEGGGAAMAEEVVTRHS